MKNQLIIDLDDLSFDLSYPQGKQIVRHLFEMPADRGLATLVTKTYEYIDGDLKCVGSVGECVDVNSYKEAWRGARLCWALKGIWGLPTDYGNEKTQSKP